MPRPTLNPTDMKQPPEPTVWPYPRWVAHRGAGKLAPENTLAAFRLGAAHGYRMFECDAKLSSDGAVFLLHDDTLNRTSNGLGIAGHQTWAALSRLDAGAWHSAAFVGEPLATLESVTRFCLANGYCLNIEIKPTTGRETDTGRIVAELADRLWAASPVPPLLTSFSPEALSGAREAAPDLPRGLLLESLWPHWLKTALKLDCAAVVCDHHLWSQETMGMARGAGLRTLAYTVNAEAEVQRLLGLDIDGIITDQIDVFEPGR
jgi:glycerophosphoryl diester phosphodiesterase